MKMQQFSAMAGVVMLVYVSADPPMSWHGNDDIEVARVGARLASNSTAQQVFDLQYMPQGITALNWQGEQRPLSVTSAST